MPRHIHTNQVDYSRTILSQEEGGTGHRTAQEAAVALGLITQATIDGDSSYFKLDSKGQIKINNLPKDIQTISNTIAGVSSMTVNSSANFTIVDYDAYTDYTVVAVAGSVSHTGNTVTYNSPSSGGTHGFTINGKLYPIVVTGITIAKAVIVTPVNNATNLGPSLNITTNAFSISGGSDTYSLTELEIATDIAFINKVVTLSQNETSFNTTLPTPNQDYYIRARHKGTTYGYGTWSDISHITSKSSFMPVSEVAKLIGSGGENTSFGYDHEISPNGDYIFVGSPEELNGAGVVYIYKNVNSTWQLTETLTSSGLASNFGRSLAINDSCTEAAIASPEYGSRGTIELFRKASTGESWDTIGMIDSQIPAGHHGFGSMIGMSANGTRIAALATESSTGIRKIFIIDKITGNWTLTKVIVSAPGVTYANLCMSKDGNRILASCYTPSGRAADLFDISGVPSIIKTFSVLNSVNFGLTISISNDGKVVAFGVTTAPDKPSDAGAVYLYEENSSNWTETFIEEASLVSNSGFARSSIELSRDGTILLVSVLHSNYGQVGNTGEVISYTKQANGWAKTSTVKSTDGFINDGFGRAISISSNKSTVTISSIKRDSGNMSNGAGAVYVFK